MYQTVSYYTINFDICNSWDKLMARNNVAHLITASNLEPAVISLQKMQPIICLEHLVTELSEIHTNFWWQPGLNTVSEKHGAQSEVAPDMTNKLNNILFWIPIKVVNNPGKSQSCWSNNVCLLIFFCFQVETGIYIHCWSQCAWACMFLPQILFMISEDLLYIFLYGTYIGVNKSWL
jgi:hypothetical protein